MSRDTELRRLIADLRELQEGVGLAIQRAESLIGAGVRVDMESIQQYAEANGRSRNVGARAWFLLAGAIRKQLGVEGVPIDIAFPSAMEYAGSATIEVGSLKQLRPHLRSGMVDGYGPVLHQVLTGWIDSL